MPGIIVGVDGSHHSERALDWAIREAALRHAPLTVLTVHQVVAGYTGHAVAFPHDADAIEPTRVAVQETTDKALARVGGTAPEITVKVVLGIPAETLVNASADADLLVLGSRGHGGFERLAIGSVCDQVARHALCPVVIIPHKA